MRGVIFCLDIKIGNQVLKLPVLDKDSLHDLTNRLIQISSTTSEKREIVETRLNQQLQNLLDREKISEKVRIKVQNLLDRQDKQKKAKYYPFDNVRMLQESICHTKIKKLQYQGKNFKYFEEKSLKTPGNFKQIKILTNQIKNTELSSNEDSSFLLKKYQALQKKCDDYISKNIKNFQSLQNEPLSDRNTNCDFIQGMRPSAPVLRSITPTDIDRNFSQLNIQSSKRILQSTGITNYQNTQQLSSMMKSPLPFQPYQRKRTGKRYDYLSIEN